ncbi:MAG: DNA-binding MarR family transcriptional regulator [Paracoccaceae bacterium]|jgi:DNA-binding MarR family transcriptional regulator
MAGPPTPTSAQERPDYESGVQIEDGMELRVWLRLLTCTNLLDSEVRTRLKTTADTTLPRFDILAQLERHDGPMSMGELSKRLMVSNGNVTGLVDRLAGEGMVSRTPSPDDRRVQMVSLTPEGSKSFVKIAEDHRLWVGDMMAGLSAEEMNTLYGLLARLKESIHDAERKNSLEAAE